MADFDLVESTQHDTYPFISPTEGLKNAANGRTVLITGAGSGIGLATANSFAQALAKTVILVGRTVAKLEEAKEELSSKFSSCNVIAEQADVSDEEDVDKLFGRLQASGIEVDVLVNNAGVSAYLGSIKDCSVDAWWKNYEVMLKGPLIVTRAFLRARSKTTPAAVIMTSSIGSNNTGPNFSSYATVKSALNRVTEWVALEGKDEGIQAISFHPGGIPDTGMTSKSPEYMRQFYTETVELGADTCLYLSTPRASWLSGRYVDATFDMEELEKHKDRIEKEDLLKMAVLGVARLHARH